MFTGDTFPMADPEGYKSLDFEAYSEGTTSGNPMLFKFGITARMCCGR